MHNQNQSGMPSKGNRQNEAQYSQGYQQPSPNGNFSYANRSPAPSPQNKPYATISQPPPPMDSPNFSNSNSPQAGGTVNQQQQQQEFSNHPQRFNFQREQPQGPNSYGNQSGPYPSVPGGQRNFAIHQPYMPQQIQGQQRMPMRSPGNPNSNSNPQNYGPPPSVQFNGQYSTVMPSHQTYQTQMAPSSTQSISSNVSPEVALTDQGTRLKLMGDLEGAMRKYIEASEVNSDYAPAFYNIGVIYSELARYNDALDGYNSALKRNPYYVEAYCNIGVIYKNNGELKSAVHYYKKALAVNPNFKIARNNMAIVLTDLGTKVKNQGDVDESIEHYKQALVFNALYPDAYYNLGVAYGERGMLDKAIVCYELGIHFNPVCCEAYNNLGVIFKDSDNLERATECYKSALQINPQFSQTLNNLGVVYTMQGKLDEAYRYVKDALEANPRYAEAYNNLGVLYRDEGKMAEAIFCYDQCLKLNKDSRNAAQNRLLALNYCNNDCQRVFKAHRDWGAEFEKTHTQFESYDIQRDGDKRLRIGYISPDFFTHSVSYFIEGILSNHDKDSFEIFCYSNVVKEDSVTLHLKSFATQWRNIYGRPANEVATVIHRDQIDILVELTGHTAGNRLDVVAMKPAPIQITYLGYPNTTGLSTVDYRFTDEQADPLFTQQPFTEELIRLPNCFLTYTPPTKKPDVEQIPFLQNNCITFGSFNNLAKITPEVFALWSAVLRSVPNSRLIMKCKPFASLAVKQRILQQFNHNGVDASRVDLLPLMQSNFEHLKAYEMMDISLDSWPYSGTTTTCESLLMGVPMITLKGDCHSHNIGASLLAQVNLTDWIATSEEDYVRMAVSHASNIDKLQQIRSTLRDTLLESNICKCSEFTQNLEYQYRTVWHKYLNSQVP